MKKCCFPLTAIVISLVLCGCSGLKIDDSFASCNVGDHLAENRDGYIVKLNESFFAEFTYKNPEYIKINELLDSDSSDFLGDSKLYYSDNISGCYSNDSNIVVYSLTKNCYVLIDCKDVNNIRYFTETDGADIDLSQFTKVDI